MSVRNFDPGDFITLDDGGFGNISTTAFTYVMLVKPNSVAGGDRPVMAVAAGGAGVTAAQNGGGAAYADDDEFEGAGSSMNFTTTNWFVFAMSHASGAGAARFHAKPLGSGSWVHSNTASVTPTSFTATEFLFGRYPGGSISGDFRLGVGAIFKSNLSDGDIEGIESTPTTSNLCDMGPFALWEFNQASTATDVLDLIGSADQTALTGTNVVEGDDPAWTFDGCTPAAGPVVAWITA